MDYSGDKLSKKLRDAVAFDYEGTINSVSEIYTGSKTVYLVRITNGNVFKTVRIYDGDMEVIEELVKK